jgi:hypothetical protein
MESNAVPNRTAASAREKIARGPHYTNFTHAPS